MKVQVSLRFNQKENINGRKAAAGEGRSPHSWDIPSSQITLWHKNTCSRPTWKTFGGMCKIPMFTSDHIWDYSQTFISRFESDTVSDSQGYTHIPSLWELMNHVFHSVTQGTLNNMHGLSHPGLPLLLSPVSPTFWWSPSGLVQCAVNTELSHE